MCEQPGEPTAAPPAEPLWELVCAFRQRAPAPTIVSLARQLADGAMGALAQQALLDRCLAAAAPLPVDAEHQRRVLRAAVLAAEQDGEEVCEELMQLYSRCLLGQAGASFNDPLDGGGPADPPVSSGAHRSSPALAAPPPEPGWCYKLFAYAPEGEPAADTMRRLAALESQAAGQQQQQQQGQQQQQQGDGEETQGEAPPPPAAAGSLWSAAAGDGRHGLLALHVSLNLLEGGTGCHEWEAGFFLAEWVLSHPGLVAGRCCLEIGCGAGMVGVALHRAGAARILLTDGNPEAAANCRWNLRLNGVPLLDRDGSDGSDEEGSRGGPAGLESRGQGAAGAAQRAAAECRVLCWEDGWAGGSSDAGGSSGGDETAQLDQPSLILGADLLYDPTVIPALLSLLKQVLTAAAACQEAAARPAGSGSGAAEAGAGSRDHAKVVGSGPAASQAPLQPAAYLATTLRNEATLQQFLAAAEADPDIRIEQLAAGAGSSLGVGRCITIGGSSSPGDGTSGETQAQPTVAPAVRFQHIAALDAARSRIFLHRLTLVGT